MNQFEVQSDRIHSHAATVSDVADQLSTIAGRLPNALGDGALGAFTQFITAGLGGAMSQTTDAIAHASSSVDEMSEGLRRTAVTYQSADDRNTAQFNGEGI